MLAKNTPPHSLPLVRASRPARKIGSGRTCKAGTTRRTSSATNGSDATCWLFERKRPQIYRECRQSALGQIGGPAGGKELLAGPDGVRATDMLSFKYALLHYVDRVPDWLVKLPR